MVMTRERYPLRDLLYEEKQTDMAIIPKATSPSDIYIRNNNVKSDLQKHPNGLDHETEEVTI